MIEAHRHCECGRVIRPSATACAECFVRQVDEEMDRLMAEMAEEAPADRRVDRPAPTGEWET